MLCFIVTSSDVSVSSRIMRLAVCSDTTSLRRSNQLSKSGALLAPVVLVLDRPPQRLILICERLRVFLSSWHRTEAAVKQPGNAPRTPAMCATLTATVWRCDACPSWLTAYYARSPAVMALTPTRSRMPRGGLVGACKGATRRCGASASEQEPQARVLRCRMHRAHAYPTRLGSVHPSGWPPA